MVSGITSIRSIQAMPPVKVAKKHAMIPAGGVLDRPHSLARWATGAFLTASFIVNTPSVALSDQISPVGQLFTTSCAGCHAGGGNIVNRQATLSLKDLEKYGIDNVDGLYNVIYSGRGSMPGYGEGCAPKLACTFGPRLTEDDIRGLASYVLDQAKAGWTS